MLCEGNWDNHVKCYDGSTWHDLGDVGNYVYALTVWNGMLCEGNVDDHVKCYDGSTWHDLGDVGEEPYVLTVWNGMLCEGNMDDHVKCYDGTTWHDLGDVGAGWNFVFGLTVWNGMLCEGNEDDHVKCYDGSTWHDLGDVGDAVYALTAWNGMLCEGNYDNHVKCYIHSERLGDYWYRQGNDIRYDYDVHTGSLSVSGNAKVAGDLEVSGDIKVKGKLSPYTNCEGVLVGNAEGWMTEFGYNGNEVCSHYGGTCLRVYGWGNTDEWKIYDCSTSWVKESWWPRANSFSGHIYQAIACCK